MTQGLCADCKAAPRAGCGYCRECKNRRNRERYANPEHRAKAIRKAREYYDRELRGTAEGRRRARARALKATYGLEAGDYALLHERQDGRCVLCREPLETGKTHVDHCHASGAVRGLLCIGCNVGLGQYERMLARPGRTRLDEYTATKGPE